MMGTVLVASAHLLVAALARKREMGFGKALLLSVLLTPLLSLPLVLRSRRLPKRSPERKTSPSRVNADAPDGADEYGYRKGGRILSDSYILSLDGADRSVTSDEALRVPPERRRSISCNTGREKTMHL